jgi:hypothetical protein
VDTHAIRGVCILFNNLLTFLHNTINEIKCEGRLDGFKVRRSRIHLLCLYIKLLIFSKWVYRLYLLDVIMLCVTIH